MTAPVTFADKVTVRVGTPTFARVTGTGPGVMTGEQYVLLPVRIENGSNGPLDVSQVVVSATRGRPARVAQRLYVDGSADFSGQIAPGSSADASYAFAIHSSSTKAVTVIVDIDSRRMPAILRG